MRLIDAEGMMEYINSSINAMTKIGIMVDGEYLWGLINDAIDNAPTVDAVEVVRCDDCIYRDGKTPGQPNILCWQMHVDDFCSYGTRVDERR